MGESGGSAEGGGDPIIELILEAAGGGGQVILFAAVLQLFQDLTFLACHLQGAEGCLSGCGCLILADFKLNDLLPEVVGVKPVVIQVPCLASGSGSTQSALPAGIQFTICLGDLLLCNLQAVESAAIVPFSLLLAVFPEL